MWNITVDKLLKIEYIVIMDEKTKKKMEQEYLKSNGTRCPICKSDNITVISCCGDTDTANRIKRTIDCQEIKCVRSGGTITFFRNLKLFLTAKKRKNYEISESKIC